jgi:uncharacterized protein YjbJ (UPF0337 family)
VSGKFKKVAKESIKGALKMNKCQLSGAAIYLVGKLGEQVGRLIGNNRLQTASYQKQIAGKAKYAVGDAQQLIKHCMKRQDRSLPAQISRS